MIDFKTHIKLLSNLSDDSGIEDYLQELEPLERIKIARAIKEVYPIREDKVITDYIKSNFSVTLTVEEAVLGQFIMLEQIVTGKTKFKREYERDLAFAKLILRPKHHKEFDNEKVEDEIANEKAILDSPVQDIYSVINYYLDNRDFVLFKQFSGVFYEMPDDDEEITDDKKEEKTSENLFHNQWYWYSIVRTLAKEDITRYNEIYMLKMSTVLPEMSFLAQRDKIEKAQRRKQEALNKL